MAESFKNSYKVSDKEMVSLSVYNVGYQRCDPVYQWGPGVRDHYLIHLVLSGKGTYHAKNQKYALQAGDVFLVYPHTTVTYASDRDDPWEYYWVGFNGSDAAFILESAGFHENEPILHAIPWADELKDALLRIYDARGNGLANSVEMTGRLYNTLALLLASGSAAAICTGRSARC